MGIKKNKRSKRAKLQAMCLEHFPNMEPQKTYLRVGVLPAAEVLEIIPGHGSAVLLGQNVKTAGTRLMTFKKRGCTCVTCGLVGSYFAMEADLHSVRNHVEDGKILRFHLNLYGVDKAGNEVLMTKDHIIPRSRGGADKLVNMQTMCTVCNSIKGNRLERM